MPPAPQGAVDVATPRLNSQSLNNFVKKNRYISIVPGNAGERVALRVTLADLDGFGSFVAETRWAGPPSDYPEEDSSDPDCTFVGARLQCDPRFRDWGTIDLLQVFGGEIIPNSSYDVQTVHESCAELLDDPDLSHSLAAAGRQFALQHFDWNRVALTYNRLLTSF